jgi:phospholipid-translocating ATPase
MATLINNAVNDEDQAYLGDDNSDENALFNFFSYFLLLNTMIPISLVVTLEIIKVMQCYFIATDSLMYSVDDDAGCHVSAVSINRNRGFLSQIITCRDMHSLIIT